MSIQKGKWSIQKVNGMGSGAFKKEVSFKCNENRVVVLHHGNPPLLHVETNGPCRPTTALQLPSVGVPASPWMWAKARSKRAMCIDSPVRRRGGVKCSENGVVVLHGKAVREIIVWVWRKGDGCYWKGSINPMVGPSIMCVCECDRDWSTIASCGVF
jgi:hypothetical protein